MTTTSVTTPAPATTRDLSLPTALLAVGSLGYIAAGALTEGGPGRAGYLHPLNAPACTLAAVGATILALVLAAWRPSGLPRWATQLAAAGMVFTAAAAWVSGTVMVGLADTMPDDASFLACAASAWGMAFFAPKGVSSWRSPSSRPPDGVPARCPARRASPWSSPGCCRCGRRSHRPARSPRSPSTWCHGGRCPPDRGSAVPVSGRGGGSGCRAKVPPEVRHGERDTAALAGVDQPLLQQRVPRR